MDVFRILQNFTDVNAAVLKEVPCYFLTRVADDKLLFLRSCFNDCSAKMAVLFDKNFIHQNSENRSGNFFRRVVFEKSREISIHPDHYMTAHPHRTGERFPDWTGSYVLIKMT